MIDRNLVGEDDIALVVDGLKQYLQQFRAKQKFDATAMKNLMEPIFERAGYRSDTHTHTQGGGVTTPSGSILIIHEGAAGDFVVMSAGIREIRRIYPTAHITLVVEKCAGALAECCPHIDELLVIDFSINGRRLQDHSFNPSDVETMISFNIGVAERLLKHRFDLAFAMIWGSSPTNPLLAYMSGAKTRVSNDRSLFTELSTEKVPYTRAHACDRMLGLIEHLIRAPIINRKMEAWFSPTDVSKVYELLPASKKFYAIGLGGIAKRKHYPPMYYAALMNLILEREPDVKFILLGGSAEVEDGKTIQALVDRDHVVDLTGKTTFRQTTAALSFCDMYIGNDTSSIHLATAVGRPIICLSCLSYELWYEVWHDGGSIRDFRPYDVPAIVVCPEHPLPECRGSRSYFGCRAGHPHCITQISPSDMFDAYKLLLRMIDSPEKNICTIFR